MFQVTENKGFKLTLPNGITLSSQLGWGNYCDNRDTHERPLHPTKCKNCEIAVWDQEGEWITKQVLESVGISDADDVAGWITMDQWIKILNACVGWKGAQEASSVLAI